MLRWGWSKDLYGSGHEKQRDNANEEFTVNVTLVDEALTSQRWCDSMRVLDQLHSTLRFAFPWAEGCTCHSSSDPMTLSTAELTRLYYPL
eukprot:5623231-Amphidinium_carterae.1